MRPSYTYPFLMMLDITLTARPISEIDYSLPGGSLMRSVMIYDVDKVIELFTF